MAAARRFLAQFVEAVHRQMAGRIHFQIAVKHRICKRFLNGHFDRRRDGIVNDAAVAKGGDEFSCHWQLIGTLRRHADQKVPIRAPFGGSQRSKITQIKPVIAFDKIIAVEAHQRAKPFPTGFGRYQA